MSAPAGFLYIIDALVRGGLAVAAVAAIFFLLVVALWWLDGS